MNAPAETETPAWPLGQMETTLGETESFIRMIGHLALSPNEVEQDEWLTIENRLLELHGELKSLWQAAWDERRAERTAHETELAAAQARTAPGSQAEVECVASHWHLLRATAETIQAFIADARRQRLTGDTPESGRA